MGRPPIDLTGCRFGILTAVRPSGRSDNRGVRWTCVCDCGNECENSAATLRCGRVASCGCRQGPYKHGGARRSGYHFMYDSWSGMRARCNQEGHKDYPSYGGRGVRVCSRWADFDLFLEDVGERPSNPSGWDKAAPYWSLDRIDPDGDYEPGNTRWATWTEQANNRRPRKTINS